MRDHTCFRSDAVAGSRGCPLANTHRNFPKTLGFPPSNHRPRCIAAGQLEPHDGHMPTRTKPTTASREAAARTAKANTDSLAILERLRETMPDCDPSCTTEADAARAESIRAGLRFLAKSLGLAC